MQKKQTQIDLVRDELLGVQESLLILFNAVVEAGAMSPQLAERTLEEMLVTLDRRKHDYAREDLREALAAAPPRGDASP